MYIEIVISNKSPDRTLVPAAFGIAKDVEEAEFEKGRSTALRLHVFGTKKVLVTSATKVKTFMETVKGITTFNGGDGIRNFMKQLNPEGLEELSNFTDVWYATVGPLQVLVTPFDSVIFESVNKDEDCLGYRANFFLKTDFESGAMEMLHEWHIASRKPNIYLSNAIEALAILKMD